MAKNSVRKILTRHSIKPFKGFGQNFLVDKAVLFKIIGIAEIKVTDIIMEIGSGTGILTQEIAKKAGKVIAIEKDPKMVKILKETLKDYKNVEIIQGDALKIQISNLKSQNYKVVANLPYYITSPVIRKFLESKNPPTLMVLMVQKEVAQRICAKPPRMNLLAVSVQFYSKPEIVDYVQKSSFWPQPKVDSAIIKIIPLKAGGDRISAELFFRIVKAGFAQPRKQLANNFMKRLVLSLPKGVKLNSQQVNDWLLKNGVNPKQRAESLTPENWKNLTKSFRRFF